MSSLPFLCLHYCIFTLPFFLTILLIVFFSLTLSFRSSLLPHPFRFYHLSFLLSFSCLLPLFSTILKPPTTVPKTKPCPCQMLAIQAAHIQSPFFFLFLVCVFFVASLSHALLSCLPFFSSYPLLMFPQLCKAWPLC